VEPYNRLLRALAVSLGVAVAITVLFLAIWWFLDRMGWHAVSFWAFGIMYGLLVGALGSEILGYDLIYCLRRANERLKRDGLPKTQSYNAVKAVIADDVESGIGFGLIGVTCFMLSCLAWARTNPEIFTRPATMPEVALYVADLLFKGALFDTFEHFRLATSPLVRRDGQMYFALYTFSFRSFVSFVVLGTVIRASGMYMLVHKLPQHKSAVFSFIRHIDTGKAKKPPPAPGEG